jgi:hypothetical protein
VIKALGAIAPALVSREVYYPGAKHLVPILQLLIPGIDLVCRRKKIRVRYADAVIERPIEDGMSCFEPQHYAS